MRPLSCAGFLLPPVNRSPLNHRASIYLVIDTLRADRLGCYGYSKIETPNPTSRAARRPV
jgi:hypothetical protein